MRDDMAHRVCPWWLGYFLASPLRRLTQDPGRLLAPYVREGMIVVEPGPGMGFFTSELARRVGSSGRVIAVDIQPRMLHGLERRVARAGLSDRVQTRLSRPDSMGLDDLSGSADLVVAFAVVHEMPDSLRFFQEAAQLLKAHGCLLLAEPPGHVNVTQFEEELAHAGKAGLRVVDRPRIPRSRAALLTNES